jgi:hypothetical protein
MPDYRVTCHGGPRRSPEKGCRRCCSRMQLWGSPVMYERAGDGYFLSLAIRSVSLDTLRLAERR